MKKILFSVLFMVGIMQFGLAQEQRQFKSPQEKTDEIMAQMQVLKLDDATTAKVSFLFKDFYTKQQQQMREYRNAEHPDREAAITALKKLGNERDDSLKTMLNDEQYKKYLSDIQPNISVRKKRGGNK